jgi:hypothetical protein
LAVARGIAGIKLPMYITDQDCMLALMELNIEKNNLSQQVKARVYDWGEKPPPDMPAQPDIILAADCVYYEPAFPLLLKTLVDLIGDNSICYFCFKKRRHADMQFIKAMKKTFIVELISGDHDHDTYSKEKIFLCVISSFIDSQADIVQVHHPEAINSRNSFDRTFVAVLTRISIINVDISIENRA